MGIIVFWGLVIALILALLNPIIRRLGSRSGGEEEDSGANRPMRQIIAERIEVPLDESMTEKPVSEEQPASKAFTEDENLEARRQLLNTHKTKSAAIRFLADQGMTRADIARLLGIRYQHVRNVLVTPLKKKASE